MSSYPFFARRGEDITSCVKKGCLSGKWMTALCGPPDDAGVVTHWQQAEELQISLRSKESIHEETQPSTNFTADYYCTWIRTTWLRAAAKHDITAVLFSGLPQVYSYGLKLFIGLVARRTSLQSLFVGA